MASVEWSIEAENSQLLPARICDTGARWCEVGFQWRGSA